MQNLSFYRISFGDVTVYIFGFAIGFSRFEK